MNRTVLERAEVVLCAPRMQKHTDGNEHADEKWEEAIKWAEGVLKRFKAYDLNHATASGTPLRRKALYTLIEQTPGIGHRTIKRWRTTRICDHHRKIMDVWWSRSWWYDPRESGRWNQPYYLAKRCPLDDGTDLCHKEKVRSKVKEVIIFKDTPEYRERTPDQWREADGDDIGIEYK